MAFILRWSHFICVWPTGIIKLDTCTPAAVQKESFTCNDSVLDISWFFEWSTSLNFIRNYREFSVQKEIPIIEYPVMECDIVLIKVAIMLKLKFLSLRYLFNYRVLAFVFWGNAWVHENFVDLPQRSDVSSVCVEQFPCSQLDPSQLIPPILSPV